MDRRQGPLRLVAGGPDHSCRRKKSGGLILTRQKNRDDRPRL